MLTGLLTELFGGARKLTGAIVTLGVAIYVCGFIIVNAHLAKLGVARIELFQPPFIAAGLLFVFVAITAILFILPLLSVISLLLDLTNAAWQMGQDEIGENAVHINPVGDRERWLYSSWLLPVLRLLHRRFRYLEWICLAFAVIAFVVGIYLLEWLASWLTAILFGFAEEVTMQHPRVALFQGALQPILRLHGISAMSVLLLLNYRNKLGELVQPFTIGLVAVSFLFVQAYNLFGLANELYVQLPISIGGGKPIIVQFLVEENKVQLLEAMGVPVEDSPIAVTKTVQIDPEAITAKADCSSSDEGRLTCLLDIGANTDTSLFKTDIVTMTWLLSGDNASSYMVQPTCLTPPCLRAVMIHKSLVSGVLYP
jgi:hypothetical protein